jgi:hypothetical protein
MPAECGPDRRAAVKLSRFQEREPHGLLEKAEEGFLALLFSAKALAVMAAKRA